MERTLVILKPSCIERGLTGEIISRFERKGLQLAGMKMIQLTDEMLAVHYAHMIDKPYYNRVKKSMEASPVIVQCWEGCDAIHAVRSIIGVTNGREAMAGTIRGDFSMSSQENLVHASDSPETAEAELKHFFDDKELFNHTRVTLPFIYSVDELTK